MAKCAFIKAVFSLFCQVVTVRLAANGNIAKRQTGVSIYCNMHTAVFFSLTQCAGMLSIKQTEELNLFDVTPFDFLTIKSNS